MSNIDISVAVATPNGLITPIVKNVPNRSLDDVANTIKDLAGRAREGRLTLDEFQVHYYSISTSKNDFLAKNKPSSRSG